MKYLQTHEYLGDWAAHVLEFVLAIPVLNKWFFRPARKVARNVFAACAAMSQKAAVACLAYLIGLVLTIWARFNREAVKELVTVVAIVALACLFVQSLKESTRLPQQYWPEC
jgi:hypothetical protein